MSIVLKICCFIILFSLSFARKLINGDVLFKKIFFISLISLFNVGSSFGVVEYGVRDLGTSQTYISLGLDLNDEGSVLAAYRIRGPQDQLHFFVRTSVGTFHEIPASYGDLSINWQRLTADGMAVGVGSAGEISYIFKWDLVGGVQEQGSISGRSRVIVGGGGQLVVSKVGDPNGGLGLQGPAMLSQGNLNFLDGLEGELGLQSEESYAFDMNGQGEVVGKSLASEIYKNTVHKRYHATMWVNGSAVDLHGLIPRTLESEAVGINEKGDLLIRSIPDQKLFFVGVDQHVHQISMRSPVSFTNSGYISDPYKVVDHFDNLITDVSTLTDQVLKAPSSVWIQVLQIIRVNDAGEILAQARNIYGEEHIILLEPKV